MWRHFKKMDYKTLGMTSCSSLLEESKEGRRGEKEEEGEGEEEEEEEEEEEGKKV